MREAEVIERLRRIATAPAARGLLDDVAVLDGLVLTHDSIAEGVHFLPEDPPASVGWKLVTVNLSDLAAKGATPAGALLSLSIAGPGEWEINFLSGVEAACESYGLPLIGGDTIALPAGAPRVLGLTAIGRAGPNVPDRASGKPGDALWLVGTGGDDYALLAALPPDLNPETLSLPKRTRITRIGELVAGEPGISLTHGGKPVELPETLGFEHQGHDHRRLSAPPMADRP